MEKDVIITVLHLSYPLGVRFSSLPLLIRSPWLSCESKNEIEFIFPLQSRILGNTEGLEVMELM